MRNISKIFFIYILAATSIALMLGLAGCQTNPSQDTGAQAQTGQAQDPIAAANLASSDVASNNDSDRGSRRNYADEDDDTSFGQPVLYASQPPPPLPDYDQPPCPDDGYLWTPGYWHWSPAGYYWVPGTWVQPPQVGLLWTPGYWGYVGGVYAFHGGYWGPHVGYYGGVNYGFGYVGVGFVGGRWEGNRFAYNTAVNRVNTTVIHNTYNTTVINNVTINKVSYNGGPGGVAAQPTPQERAAARESHVSPTVAQTSHVQEARNNPALFAKANGGHPAIAATARPAAFSGPGVVGAHGANTSPPIQNFNKPAGNANPGTPQAPHPMPAGQAARVPPNNQAYAAHPPAYVAKPPTQNQPPPKGKAPPNPNNKPHEGEGGNHEH